MSWLNEIPTWLIITIEIFAVWALLYFTKTLAWFKKIADDCMLNHGENRVGKYEINNVGRFLFLLALLAVFLGTHIQITLTPVNVIYKELSEAITAVILGYVALGTGIKEYSKVKALEASQPTQTVSKVVAPNSQEVSVKVTTPAETSHTEVSVPQPKPEIDLSEVKIPGVN